MGKPTLEEPTDHQRAEVIKVRSADMFDLPDVEATWNATLRRRRATAELEALNGENTGVNPAN